MTTKYRVFHKATVFTNDDGTKITDIRPFDMRDRTKANAIALASTLALGSVRPKGGSRIVWSAFDAAVAA